MSHDQARVDFFILAVLTPSPIWQRRRLGYNFVEKFEDFGEK